MSRRLFAIIILLATCASAHAEIEKTATISCNEGICLHWWPKLPVVKGWHQDKDQSLHADINAQAPDGQTFDTAETVIYANALYKPRMSETKSLQKLIDDDQAAFQSDTSQSNGVKIRETQDLVTGDGQKLRTYTYTPSTHGNWEEVSYGEEGDFYLIFAISSHTKQGLTQFLGDYKKFISTYKTNP